jgi:hypothetical protein
MGDEVRYILRLSKASLASSIHSNLPVFFSSLKKGSPFSPSHEMKQLRAAMLPVNFCTFFTLRGGAISVMARICLVLASILRLLTRNPSSCPEGTPKNTLVWVQFPLPFI